MNPFRSIVAMLLALLIASPLCCCFAGAGESPERASCCKVERGTDGGEESPEREPHACACDSKEPREIAKHLELPQDLAASLEPAARDFDDLQAPAPVRLPRAGTPHTGCDPPRRLLARYSRWLI